jgi:AcrR family transcriptional regulator
MKTTAKLTSEERRAAIIQAVRRVFAENGFHGTTTRELAKAAGVSEALLFKHFPNKEALYSAMQRWCCEARNPGAMERLKALEPSTSTLVLLVHSLVSHIVAGRPRAEDDESIQTRLMLRSMMEDGEFARLTLQQLAACWIPKVEASIREAVKAGEAVEGPVHAAVGAWFTQQLASSVMIHLLPAARIVDHGLSREQLVEQAVWFVLRGLGLKDEVIKRYYNAKALGMVTG